MLAAIYRQGFITGSLIFACVTGQLDAGESFFESGEARLRYVSEGEGEAVFLVHGFAENLEKGWIETGIFDRLKTGGFQVVALDCRGHGSSSRLHQPDLYGLNMVQDLVCLLDKLEIEKAHFVGYSMGAVIVNKLRESHPERLLSVTLSGFGNPPLPLKVTATLVKEIEGNLGKMNLLKGNDPRSLACLSVGWNAWKVSEANLRNNKVRALALIGAGDVFLADTKKLVAGMPKTSLELVPGDHGSARSHPRFIETLLGFLLAQ